MRKTLYSIDEVVLVPTAISYISSRSECHPYYGGRLPIFIAPMSCITDDTNYSAFESFGFNPILPRSVDWNTRKAALREGKWVAAGLDEGYELVKEVDNYKDLKKIKLCIDIANGHQFRSYSLCADLKRAFPQMELMVGNIANPESYVRYAEAGADYVRIGIGSGQVCTTSVQTGIHYPMASLISECNNLRQGVEKKFPKIVADGGFKYIDQIVKALALGADYVMIGKIAASFPEACGKVELHSDGGRCREYYGMSTEKAQKLMHPEPGYIVRHSEGTVRWIPVIPSTKAWIGDFVHALKSCMSYCNAHNLTEFVGKTNWGIQNPTTFNAYIKS